MAGAKKRSEDGASPSGETAAAGSHRSVGGIERQRSEDELHERQQVLRRRSKRLWTRQRQLTRNLGLLRSDQAEERAAVIAEQQRVEVEYQQVEADIGSIQHRLRGDQPGVVDDTAYVGATELLLLFRKEFPSYAKLKWFVEAADDIRSHHPTKQRLMIHAGDFIRHLHALEVAKNLLVDNEAAQDALSEAAVRQAEVRAEKAARGEPPKRRPKL
jgi:hypothetical protein